MNKPFSDLNLFEDWFRTKLIEEKKRRVNYITSIWDSLNLKKRNFLIEFLNNKVLTQYKPAFIEKNYGEFYRILKDQFELCYELIHSWSKANVETKKSKGLE